MYKVVCTDSNGNNHNLYIGSVESLKINDAKIELELGKSGSFDFTIYSSHPCYDAIENMKSIITVYDDTTIIFRGRVLNDEIGMYKEKHVTCEGDLSFLLDTMIGPHSYSGSFSGYLSYIVLSHNVKVETNKQFNVGTVEPSDFTPFIVEETEYKTAWDLLNTHMVSKSGGYLSVRYEDFYTRYIDLLDSSMDITNISTQNVEFGKNMLDIQIASQNQDVFSCIIPLGAKLNGTEKRLDIRNVNGNSDYISNTSAILKYGRIYKTIIYDDITVASTLYLTAKNYLDSHYDAEVSTEITAVDLSSIEPTVDAFKLGQYVNVYSEHHFATNPQMLLIKKLTVNILNPAENQITIGSIKKGITDIASGGSSSTSVINQEAEQPYLMDSGTTDIWKWAKYSDGTAECFGKIPLTSIDVLSSFGSSWYRSDVLYDESAYQYPITFTEAPCTEMMFQTRNGSAALVWAFSSTTQNAQQYLPQCYLIRPSTSDNVTGNINIIVKGKYNANS